MKLWPLVIVLASPAVHARPARTRASLRVTVTCADYFVAPRDGLELRVDGVAQPAAGIGWSSYERRGQAYAGHETDVGYVVAPGAHHLELTTPDCAGAADVDVPVTGGVVAGPLAIANDALRGTATAPDGLGLVLGGFYAARPAHTSVDPVFRTAYAFDGTTQAGGQLTVTADYRHWVLAFDQRYTTEGSRGRSDASGTFAGRAFDTGYVGRFGPRWAIHDVELAVGGGAGGDLLHGGGHVPGTKAAVGYAGRFFLPVWATLTYKPACAWGVQAMATYEVHPTSGDESAPAFAAGLLYQPSRACAEPPHLDVR